MPKCAICEKEVAGGVVVHRGCLKQMQGDLDDCKRTIKIVIVLGSITLILSIVQLLLRLV